MERSMKKGIAYRRAQKQRLKKLRHNWWGRELSPDELGRVITTPTPCSCWMCGNPRRYLGERTVQEQRLLQDLE